MKYIGAFFLVLMLEIEMRLCRYSKEQRAQAWVWLKAFYDRVQEQVAEVEAGDA